MDPTVNHDECVSIFNAVGIYMVLDVNSPFQSINRADPASSYGLDYLTRVFQMIEAFKGYPNLLGFFSANEVVNDENTGEEGPPYIRALQREMKNYISNHADRSIPVGYAAADVRDNLQDQWNYLECAIDGNVEDRSRVDFFGLNSYSWCGSSTFEESGYDDIAEIFSNSTGPVFFSEYGCNEVQPRTFPEVTAVYSEQMRTFSGGVVYEFTQEANNYGLVEINDDGSAQLLDDFDALQRAHNEIDTDALQGNTTGTQFEPVRCDPSLIQNDNFANSWDLPPVPSGVQDLINNGLQNPNQGRLVDVNQTAVPQTVRGSGGNVINNLAIVPLTSGSGNVPEDGDTSGGRLVTPSGVSNPPQASATGAAVSLRVGASEVGLIGGLLTLLML